MKRYRYLLFDADNTLFDFTKAEYLSFAGACSACNIAYSEVLYKQYSDINDGLWKLHEQGRITLDSLKLERFRKLLLTNGFSNDSQTEERAAEMRDSYMLYLSRQTCLIDGAEDICRKLSEKYEMYIVTNGIGMIQRSRFAGSVLTPFFRGMFVSEEIGASKPSSEYYDHVLSTIGCGDKMAYLAIGDSLTSDCAGAINYGLDICFFDRHDRPTGDLDITYTIRYLSELEAILL